MLRNTSLKIPLVTKNKIKIGLLFGSFNPPHQGHIEISIRAKKILNLDDIYWIITPKNPKKDPNTLLPIKKRFLKAQKIAKKNNFRLSDIEIKCNSKYTYNSIKLLKNIQPYAKFVFIIGADIVPDILKWRFAHRIIKQTDIFIEKRANIKTNATQFAYYYQKNRKHKICFLGKKSWMYDNFIKNPISATSIRKQINYK